MGRRYDLEARACGQPRHKCRSHPSRRELEQVPKGSAWVRFERKMVGEVERYPLWRGERFEGKQRIIDQIMCRPLWRRNDFIFWRKVSVV